MAKLRNPKRTALIWALSAFLFFFAFQMLLNNSSSSSSSSSSDASISYVEQRARLYDKMARDLEEHGAAFLKRGETSQSLALSDLFVVKDGIVTPTPKPANPPVRANVLYLSTEYSVPISNAVKDVFLPYFGKEDEIEAEANAVKSVTESFCPLKIVLDRVVLTSTGVLLGCWQVTSGTDPATIRSKLRNALPRAPEKQLYDSVILHTSFARLLGPPRIPERDPSKTSNEILLFHDLVARLNNQIRGFEAVVSELWYVEELDVLALALDGRMKVRKFKLGCSKT